RKTRGGGAGPAFPSARQARAADLLGPQSRPGERRTGLRGRQARRRPRRARQARAPAVRIIHRHLRGRRILPAKPSRAIADRMEQRDAPDREALPPPATPTPGGSEPPVAPSPRCLRGLDWCVLFVADVQTGFGPFISVFLTTQRWTQFDIGLVQSVAGIVSLVGQMPGGAVVDAARSERFVAGVAIVAICVSAMTYAALPVFPVVLAGAILHALASCVLGPAIAAMSPCPA